MQLSSPRLNIARFVCNWGTQELCVLLTFKPDNQNMEDVLNSSCETEEGRLSAETLGLDTLSILQ